LEATVVVTTMAPQVDLKKLNLYSKLSHYWATFVAVTITAPTIDFNRKYHAVIFHFLFRNKNNGLLNPDPPLKSTVPLGAKST
jgi:hypothetical protein